MYIYWLDYAAFNIRFRDSNDHLYNSMFYTGMSGHRCKM